MAIGVVVAAPRGPWRSVLDRSAARRAAAHEARQRAMEDPTRRMIWLEVARALEAAAGENLNAASVARADTSEALALMS